MNKLITYLWLLLLSLRLSSAAYAHEGEDHGGGKAGAPAGTTSFSTHALSEKFELLLRYAPLQGGQPAHLTLFVADYATNAPVPGAKITLTNPEDASLKWTVTAQDSGVYRVEGRFPANKNYSFAANVVAGNRADLLLLEGVAVGQKLPAATEPAAPAASLFNSWKNVLLLGLAFGAGVLLTALLMRRRRAGQAPTSIPVVHENQA